MNNGKKKKGCLIVFLAVFVITVLAIIIGSVVDNGNNSGNGTNNAETANNQNVRYDSITWKITKGVDEMTDSEIVWAKITSDNYVNQDFPYEGDTYSTITIRYKQKNGYDVIIGIDRGQIIGDDWDGSNYITVRFDKDTPKKYYFSMPADYSTESVFLRNANDFIEKCKRANDIKIQLKLYDNGNPTFSFHVDKPLDWDK